MTAENIVSVNTIKVFDQASGKFVEVDPFTEVGFPTVDGGVQQVVLDHPEISKVNAVQQAVHILNRNP